MSLIKLQGNPSGTGAFTIAAPNGNTDRTLTLPDATGTVLAAPAGSVTISSSAPSNSLTVDGSGNLGLGVTPMSWSGAGHLDIVDDGGVFSKGPYMTVGSNWYFNSGFKYQTTAAAARYQQDNGIHKFFTSPSGTAGNAVTFTERVRIDSNGLKFNGDTAAANALDDYEEGTWTPTFVNGTWTYGARDSFYTKVGNLVLLSGRIVWNARSGSGELKIGSLPFTPLTGLIAARACGSLGTCDGLDTAGSKQIVLAADGNINELVLRFINDNASWSAVELQNCNSGGELQFAISYPT